MAEIDKRVGVNLRPHVDPACEECDGTGVGSKIRETEFVPGIIIETLACACIFRSVEKLNREYEAST